MPRYILIAGVNGAGKSTLFHLLRDIWNMPRINTDEIIRGVGNWKNPADVMKAGKIVVGRLNQLLEEKATFYDNTESFRRFAIYKHGELVKLSHHVPNWFEKNIL